MPLASMLQHGSGRDDGRLAHGIHHHQPQHYAQSYSRPQQPHLDIQSALNSYQYPAQQQVHYTYQPAPQSPPSPPVEDLGNKPSLPSISSLLGIAGGERETQDAGQQQQAQQAQQPPKPEAQQFQDQRMQQPQHQAQSAAPPQDPRVESIHQGYNPGAVNHKMTLPPTPPLQPDSAADGNHSPSTISSHSSLSAPPYYLGQSLNNVEPHQQRQQIPSQGIVKRHSLPLQTSGSPYTTSPYASSPYTTSPSAASAPGYYSPENQVYPAAGMYHQRPLPSNFPPPVAVNMPPNPNGHNPWQHHHYISASSQAAFPQSQDRYICQTCNKAFSRPSSLRIHSHSHTGEKPFKCPHAGCGKAFSVRSNMKRHERGCHANPGASVSAS